MGLFTGESVTCICDLNNIKCCPYLIQMLSSHTLQSVFSTVAGSQEGRAVWNSWSNIFSYSGENVCCFLCIAPSGFGGCRCANVAQTYFQLKIFSIFDVYTFESLISARSDYIQEKCWIAEIICFYMYLAVIRLFSSSFYMKLQAYVHATIFYRVW